MGHQGLGSSVPGSLNCCEARIQGDHHPLKRSSGITDLQTDIVPVFSQFRCIKFVNKSDQILYALSLFYHCFPAVFANDLM